MDFVLFKHIVIITLFLNYTKQSFQPPTINLSITKILFNISLMQVGFDTFDVQESQNFPKISENYKSENPQLSQATVLKEGLGKYNQVDRSQKLKQFEKIFLDQADNLHKLNSQTHVGDRFIPKRKELKHVTLQESGSDLQNQSQYLEVQQNTVSISDIYKRYIMMDNTKELNLESKEKIKLLTYQNNNIFKYQNNNNYKVQTGKIQNNQIWNDLSKFQKKRKISTCPLKVLDAPALQNDYYLNVIDWSYDNIVGVGLASSVYLWNGATSKVSKLCDVHNDDTVCSVSWSDKSPQIAVGSSSGEVKIWDIVKSKNIRTMFHHSNRVSVISWRYDTFCSGSKDKTIIESDPRASKSLIRKLAGHNQQICGLKWSPDKQQFCSGGNDNKLLVWNTQCNIPVHKFLDHKAAVKAVAWSPHQHGLLVSGGGTADRTIKFRNTYTGQTVKSYKVGSQVCNLMFSKTLNELVSTHGYTLNEINIWKYPKMQKIATLTGHKYRVLYLAMSPDGSTIVSGAGDQTLRFWKVFPSQKQQKISQIGNLEKMQQTLR